MGKQTNIAINYLLQVRDLASKHFTNVSKSQENLLKLSKAGVGVNYQYSRSFATYVDPQLQLAAHNADELSNKLNNAQKGMADFERSGKGFNSILKFGKDALAASAIAAAHLGDVVVHTAAQTQLSTKEQYALNRSILESMGNFHKMHISAKDLGEAVNSAQVTFGLGAKKSLALGDAAVIAGRNLGVGAESIVKNLGNIAVQGNLNEAQIKQLGYDYTTFGRLLSRDIAVGLNNLSESEKALIEKHKVSASSILAVKGAFEKWNVPSDAAAKLTEAMTGHLDSFVDILKKSGVTLTDNQQKLLSQQVAQGNLTGATKLLVENTDKLVKFMDRGGQAASEVAAVFGDNLDVLRDQNLHSKKLASTLGELEKALGNQSNEAKTAIDRARDMSDAWDLLGESLKTTLGLKLTDWTETINTSLQSVRGFLYEVVSGAQAIPTAFVAMTPVILGVLTSWGSKLKNFGGAIWSTITGVGKQGITAAAELTQPIVKGLEKAAPKLYDAYGRVIEEATTKVAPKVASKIPMLARAGKVASAAGEAVNPVMWGYLLGSVIQHAQKQTGTLLPPQTMIGDLLAEKYEQRLIAQQEAARKPGSRILPAVAAQESNFLVSLLERMLASDDQFYSAISDSLNKVVNHTKTTAENTGVQPDPGLAAMGGGVR